MARASRPGRAGTFRLGHPFRSEKVEGHAHQWYAYGYTQKRTKSHRSGRFRQLYRLVKVRDKR